jgi:hypothetical protein
MLFTYDLVRRHDDELAVAALHRGVVRTGIGRHFPRVRVAAAQAFAISPKRSARNVVALATAALPRNGRYFDRDTPAHSSLTAAARPMVDHRGPVRTVRSGPRGGPLTR